MHVVADEHRARFLEHEDQRVRHQHLLQVLPVVQEAEERPLERVTEGDLAAAGVPFDLLPVDQPDERQHRAESGGETRRHHVRKRVERVDDIVLNALSEADQRDHRTRERREDQNREEREARALRRLRVRPR